MEVKKFKEIVELRPKELKSLVKDFPIVYIPSGVYEWHGEHIPMSTDTLKMIEICRRTAKLTGGVVSMPSYIGTGTIDSQGLFKEAWGSIEFSEKLVKNYLNELFSQLEKIGFKLIVLFYGHTSLENINVHQMASREYIMRKDTNIKILCMNDANPAVKYRYKVADHAAKWETSFMLASNPEYTRIDCIPNYWKWGLSPKKYASKEEGERMYGLISEMASKIITKAINLDKRSLIDFVLFNKSGKCYENCMNIDDLKNNYWKNDFVWEDPHCWFCYWLSSGVIEYLVELKGINWVRKIIEHWLKNSYKFQGREKNNFKILYQEYKQLPKQ